MSGTGTAAAARRAGPVAGVLALGSMLALGVGSCGLLGPSPAVSREQALTRPETPFAERAITVQVRADAELNPTAAQSHTVVVGVLQAQEADALRQLADQPDRIEQLLAGTPAGPEVLHLARFVVQPAQRCVLQVDRVQKARAVALGVGYAQRAAGPALRVFDIPLQLQSRGWPRRSYSAATGTLRLRLRLGAREVLDAVATPQAPDPAEPRCMRLQDFAG